VRDTYADPLLRDAARRSAQEGRAIAAGLGIDLPDSAVERVANATMAHKPSILQDLELGRPMEIDSIFGLPLMIAHLNGTPAPQLALLVALVKQAARAAGLYQEIA